MKHLSVQLFGSNGTDQLRQLFWYCIGMEPVNSLGREKKITENSFNHQKRFPYTEWTLPRKKKKSGRDR